MSASLKGPFAATHVASFVPSSLYDVSAVGRIVGHDRLSSHAACCASLCKLHARPCMQVDRMPESPLPCRLYLSSILLLPSPSLFFAFLTLTGQFSWSLIDPVRQQGAVHKTWKKGGGGVPERSSHAGSETKCCTPLVQPRITRVRRQETLSQ